MENTYQNSCEHFQMLLMQDVDGEISPEDKTVLDEHLDACSTCAAEAAQFRNLKKEATEMKKHLMPEMAWDEYWGHTFNRMERGISWILISVGAVLLIGFSLYNMVLEMFTAHDAPIVIRIGVLALVFGTLMLLISVIRERVMVSKHDKYKEVQR